MSSDDADSLLRAIAASPPIAPPSGPGSAPAAPPKKLPAPVDSSDFTQRRLSLRFVVPETEAAYRANWVREMLRPIRIGYAIGCLVVLVGGVLALGAAPTLVRSVRVTALAADLLLAAGLAATFVPRLRAHLLDATFLTAVIAVTVFNVGIGVVVPQQYQTLFFANVIVGLVGAGALLHLGFIRFGICCVAAVASFHAFDPGNGIHDGASRHRAQYVYVTVLATLAASYLNERRDRRLFQNEQLLARERARSEALMQKELQRQVAERSRGLSEALARLSNASHRPAPLALGDVVEGRYQVVRAIGSGGMGQVHEVERIADGKRLALKTLTGVAHKEALARFAREARVAAELDHANIVAALDIGVTATGTLFIVMELVAGGSLSAVRARYGDWRWALLILRQVAQALSAMHARGIVHRDLKPANILLDGDRVKVADFGLAGLLAGAPLGDTRQDSAALAPALTRIGAIMGTPLYMAPELVDGADKAEPSTDVFSLGVVAYELLSKELPFTTPPIVERLRGRGVSAPKPLAEARSDLSAELCALVDACLAYAPEARPTVDAIVTSLEGMPA